MKISKTSFLQLDVKTNFFTCSVGLSDIETYSSRPKHRVFCIYLYLIEELSL